jgi:phage baseplate assembly protein gpV
MYGDTIAQLLREVAELKRILPNLVKRGVVHEVDAKNWRVRLNYAAEGEQPILGPWVPWKEHGGAIKSWLPPSDGQAATTINPVGDQRQGEAWPSGFTDQNKQPSEKGDENVITFGPWRITLDGDVLSITGPKIKVKGDIEIAGNADFKDGHVKSNGKHIDDTHGHVSAPPGPSGPPV